MRTRIILLPPLASASSCMILVRFSSNRAGEYFRAADEVFGVVRLVGRGRSLGGSSRNVRNREVNTGSSRAPG